MDKSSKKSKKEFKEAVVSEKEFETKPAEENTGKSRTWPKADN